MMTIRFHKDFDATQMRIVAATLLLLGASTTALAQVECFDAVESRTIRDTDDNGTPDFIQVPATHLEVDERVVPQPGAPDARRVVIEFVVPALPGIVASAIVRLERFNWLNDDVDWYLAPDITGQIAIGDWFATGAVATGSIPAASLPTGTDDLNVTAALQTLNQPFFRVGLRMVNSLAGHALYYSHLSGDPPELCITYEDGVIIFTDGFESGDTLAWSDVVP